MLRQDSMNSTKYCIYRRARTITKPTNNLSEVNSWQHHFREQRTCRELIRELIWESLSFEEIITYISQKVLFVQVWDPEEWESFCAKKGIEAQ